MDLKRLTWKIRLERRTTNRLNHDTMRRKLHTMAQLAEKNSSLGFFAKVESVNRPMQIIDDDSKAEQYKYSASIEVWNSQNTDPDAVEALFRKYVLEPVQKQAASDRWTVVSGPIVATKSIPGISGNGTSFEVPVTALVVEDEPRQMFELPDLDDNAYRKFFDGVYEREAHIRMIHDSMKAYARSGGEQRSHVLLVGQPACCKTVLLERFKVFYEQGSNTDVERVAVIDGPTMSKAGLENWMMELAVEGKLPEIICVEEIEKQNMDNLLTLLSVMGSGYIMKTNAKIGRLKQVAKCVIWATCNDKGLLKRFRHGALWSRFTHKLHCRRPSRELMTKIIEDKVLKTKGYVWRQEENWVPLWESIQDVAERRLNGNPRPHFMGAIVLDQMAVSTGDIDTRQIIDGQQRMTTFQLLLTALRDICGTERSIPLRKAFDKLTKNEVPFSEDADEVFKIWPTNADRNHFRAVLTAGSPEKVRLEFKLTKKESNGARSNLIPLSYLFFYETLSEWLGSPIESEFTERLKVLWQSIKDDMQVVVIDLDEKDDAQVIFETLNALGTPLLPADLIKNFLFQSADLKTDNVEKVYEKYWKPFDEDSSFWREEVRQGRMKRPRIDLFLQHYLTLMKGDEVSATHLFGEFRDLARKRPTITTQEHLQSISRYGAIFQTFMSGFKDDSPEGRFFYRLNELDTTTVFPLLLEVFHRAGGKPSDEVLSVLCDLESFLVRRMVCGLTTKAYNSLMRTLIQKLQSNDTFSAEAVRDFLLTQDAESTRWPSDEEFEKAWLNRPLYGLLTQARVRILLEALELEMYTGKSEKIKIDSKLTIEHVLPQEWEKHWPLPVGLPEDAATKQREAILHTIGNLTLITNKLNPALSNGPWDEKRAKLSEHTLLMMNHKLVVAKTWGEQEIETRGKELFKSAIKIWPRPTN